MKPPAIAYRLDESPAFRQAVCAWFTARGVDPNRVSLRDLARTATGVQYREYVLDEDGRRQMPAGCDVPLMTELRHLDGDDFPEAPPR